MEEGWWGEKETLILQITHYETRFWSGWQGLLVSKAFTHADFAIAEESLGTNYRRLKGKRACSLIHSEVGLIPERESRSQLNTGCSKTGAGSGCAPLLMWEQQQTGVGGGKAWLGSTACMTHSPKSISQSLTAEQQPAKRLLAIQKFSIQGIKICYGVTYGTTSANILYSQMFGELQKY